MWRKIYEETFYRLAPNVERWKKAWLTRYHCSESTQKLFSSGKFLPLLEKRILAAIQFKFLIQIYVKGSFAGGLKKGNTRMTKRKRFRNWKCVIFSDYHMLFILLIHFVRFLHLKTFPLLWIELTFISTFKKNHY